MHDYGRALVAENAFEIRVLNIQLVKLGGFRDVLSFSRYEVIDHDHLMTFLKQPVHYVRADKTRSARDQHFHARPRILTFIQTLSPFAGDSLRRIMGTIHLLSAGAKSFQYVLFLATTIIADQHNR
jgi:hypothetical protein